MTRRSKKYRTIWKRVLGLIVLVIAGLLTAAWFAWFPSPKEPGYEFVKDWGGKGDGPGQLKNASSRVLQKHHRFRAVVGHGQIQVAVAVQVGCSDPARCATDGVALFAERRASTVVPVYEEIACILID